MIQKFSLMICAMDTQTSMGGFGCPLNDPKVESKKITLHSPIKVVL
jgi:hypothetical protein